VIPAVDGAYYLTKSTDEGVTWSVATPMKDTSGNYIGCARPHLLQVRMMMLVLLLVLLLLHVLLALTSLLPAVGWQPDAALRRAHDDGPRLLPLLQVKNIYGSQLLIP